MASDARLWRVVFAAAYLGYCAAGVRGLWWWGDAISNDHLQIESTASLSGNRGLPWSRELLEKFADRWDWKRISRNSAVIFDGAMLDCFSERVDFNAMSFSSTRTWTEQTIARYQSRIDWRYLSIRRVNDCRALYRRFSECYVCHVVARDCSFGIEKLNNGVVGAMLEELLSNWDSANSQGSQSTSSRSVPFDKQLPKTAEEILRRMPKVREKMQALSPTAKALELRGIQAKMDRAR